MAKANMQKREVSFDNFRIFEKTATPDVLQKLKSYYELGDISFAEKFAPPEPKPGVRIKKGDKGKLTSKIVVFQSNPVDGAENASRVFKDYRKKLAQLEEETAREFLHGRLENYLKPTPVYLDEAKTKEVFELINSEYLSLEMKKISKSKTFTQDNKQRHQSLSKLKEKFAPNKDLQPVSKALEAIRGVVGHLKVSDLENEPLNKLLEDLEDYNQALLSIKETENEALLRRFSDVDKAVLVKPVQDKIEKDPERQDLTAEEKRILAINILSKVDVVRLSDADKDIIMKPKHQAAVQRIEAEEETPWMKKKFKQANGKTFRPLSEKQALLVENFEMLVAERDKDHEAKILFALGSTGTGKTHTLGALASRYVLGENPKFDRLVIIRPAVTAGEDPGTITGNLEEKMDPFFAPFYNAMDETTGEDKIKTAKQTGKMGFETFAYARGKTWRKTLFWLTEAQNATYEQLKDLSMRFQDSLWVIDGDVAQTDREEMRANGQPLPLRKRPGLKPLLDVMRPLPGVKVVEFTTADNVRDPQSKRIAMAWEAYEENERLVAAQQKVTADSPGQQMKSNGHAVTVAPDRSHLSEMERRTLDEWDDVEKDLGLSANTTPEFSASHKVKLNGSNGHHP